MTLQDMLPPSGVVILSGSPVKVAEAVRNLPATTLPFQLIGRFESEDIDPDCWGAFVDEVPQTGIVIVPNFSPVASAEQSVIPLTKLAEFEGSTFILCVEPSTRKPIPGPRCWVDLPAAVLTLKGDTIENYRTGETLVLHEKPNHAQVLLRFAENEGGLLSYEKAKAQMIGRGCPESTFYRVVREEFDVCIVPKVRVS